MIQFFKRKKEPTKKPKNLLFNNKKCVIEEKTKEFVHDLHQRSLGLMDFDRLEGSASQQITLFGSFNSALKSSGQRLFNQGRGLALNTSIGARYVQFVTDNVVGNALTPKVMLLKSDGSVDLKLNEEIESHFWRWASSQKRFSVNDRFNFIECLQILEKERCQGGEAFLIMHDEETLQFSIRTAEECDWSYNKRVDDNTVIYQGIEYNETTMKPIAYWFRKRDLLTQSFTNTHVRYEASKVLHYFFPKTADALRGVTDFLPVIKDISHLDAWRETTIVQKRIASSSMGFIETDKSESQFELDDDNYYNKQVVADFSPGSIQELAPGQRIKQISSTQTGDDFSKFNDSMMTSIAMGLSCFQSALTGDTSNINYSSARFGDLQQRSRFKAIQDRLIDVVIMPMFEAWLRHCVMHSTLSIKMSQVSKIIENTTVIRAKYSSVDPIRDVQADIAMIEAGLKSRSSTIIERGEDPVKVFLEIANEKRELNKVISSSDETDPDNNQ